MLLSLHLFFSSSLSASPISLCEMPLKDTVNLWAEMDVFFLIDKVMRGKQGIILIFIFYNENIFMRRVYRVIVFMIAVCMQVGVVMAQGNIPVEVPSVWGVYEGTATTIIRDNKQGTATKGLDKKITIEIRKGKPVGNVSYTEVALKDFTIGQFTFADVPYTDVLLYEEQSNKRWRIYLENNMNINLQTKDKKYNMYLGGYIDDKDGFVYKDGSLELKFGVSFYKEDSPDIEYTFRGKRKQSTNGIHYIKYADNKNIVYDLQGRRVETPTKGVYIVNGKKVVF